MHWYNEHIIRPRNQMAKFQRNGLLVLMSGFIYPLQYDAVDIIQQRRNQTIQQLEYIQVRKILPR